MKRLCVVFASFVIFLFVTNNVFASNFYLLPKSRSVSVGSTVPVDVVINTKDESVNGISAYLSYPMDKLEVAWISYSDAFPVQAEESYENGIIKISRGSFVGEAGDVTIATIGFKGKAKSEGIVSFIDGSAAPRTSDSSDSLNLSESTGATLTVGQPEIKSSLFSFFFSLFSLGL